MHFSGCITLSDISISKYKQCPKFKWITAKNVDHVQLKFNEMQHVIIKSIL